VQRLVQLSCINVSRTCPGYKNILDQRRPRYLRQKGDGAILISIERKKKIHNDAYVAQIEMEKNVFNSKKVI